MYDPGSLLGLAFRYAGLLHARGQDDALDRFTLAIHPALGQLAGRGQTALADLTPRVVEQAIRDAARGHLARERAVAAWRDFLAWAEGDVRLVPDR
jgi:hypothetical protein